MDQILIIDDHPLVRTGIRALLTSVFPHSELLEAASLGEAVECITVHPGLDLVTLDLDLPDAKQLEALAEIRRRFPSVPVAVLSGGSDPSLARTVLAAGAAGFIAKSQRPETLIAAFQSIRNGEIFAAPATPIDGADGKALERFERLTPQQRTVLRMIVEGFLNKQIAHELGISETTVKAHVSGVLAKLEVVSRTQAALLAKRLNFFP